MWIVVNAMLLYNIAVPSGRFDAFRRWTLDHLPNDRRVVLVAIGFCFGALLEGVAGFGTPVAITSSLLILVGFPPLEALVFVLIFNTAPVAFGALGAPVTVLGAVTGLPAATLGAMIGRQLPFMALILPFYVMFIYGGMRSVRAMWPVLLVAGGSFALCQFVASNYHRLYADRRARLARLADRHARLPAGLAAGAGSGIRDRQAARSTRRAANDVPAWQGWLPWIIVAAVVILWTSFEDIRDRPDQRFHGPASTRRSRSRCTTTSPMPPSGLSSRWRPARPFCVAAIITVAGLRPRRRRFSLQRRADRRGRSGSPSSPSV